MFKFAYFYSECKFKFRFNKRVISSENAENIQILRYEQGQKYEPHFDYFHDKVNQARGGHRYATVLMYLSTTPPSTREARPSSPTPR